MKPWGKILLSLFILLTLLIIIGQPLLKTIGNHLVTRNELKPCDCIIVLAGEKGERVKEGVKLYKAGWGKCLIMSGGMGEAEIPLSSLMKQQAINAGVPSKLILEENKSEDTGEDAYYTRQLMKKYQLTSAILVTSPYHSRRSMFVFRKVFRSSGITLISYPVTDSWYNPEKWWQTKKGMKATFSECSKFLWYYLFPQSFNIDN